MALPYHEGDYFFYEIILAGSNTGISETPPSGQEGDDVPASLNSDQVAQLAEDLLDEATTNGAQNTLL